MAGAANAGDAVGTGARQSGAGTGLGPSAGGGAARCKSTGPSPPWDLADGEAALASQRIGRLDQRRRDPQAGTEGLYLADWFLTSSFLPGRSNWVTSQEQNHTLS